MLPASVSCFQCVVSSSHWGAGCWWAGVGGGIASTSFTAQGQPHFKFFGDGQKQLTHGVLALKRENGWRSMLEERAGCRDRWQASDEQGRGGWSFRVMNGHSSAFGIFFLQFGVPGFRVNFFDILCTFSQVSITFGGVVVALWSSGGVRAVAGVHKSYAMHKSTTVHVSSVGSLQQDRRKKTHKSIIQLYSM
jgi:hypothetical protein